MSVAWLTPAVSRLIDLALEEDLGRGDVTTSAIIDPTLTAEAEIVAREVIVVAGVDVAVEVFRRVDPTIDVLSRVGEGWPIAPGASVVTFAGNAASLLAGERTVLNFMQRLSGIATATRAFVATTEGSSTRVTDTRKTFPGARSLEKHAVRCGGGRSHRADLGSGILIKDNHVAIAGSVTEAIHRATKNAPHDLKIEVEVDNLDQLNEALAAGTDIILLDNFSTPDIEEAMARVRRTSRPPVVEISGGVTLARMPELVRMGVDFISVGAITHSARAADLSLELRPRRA